LNEASFAFRDSFFTEAVISSYPMELIAVNQGNFSAHASYPLPGISGRIAAAKIIESKRMETNHGEALRQ
jgi:hypothetical protein